MAIWGHDYCAIPLVEFNELGLNCSSYHMVSEFHNSIHSYKLQSLDREQALENLAVVSSIYNKFLISSEFLSFLIFSFSQMQNGKASASQLEKPITSGDV